MPGKVIQIPVKTQQFLQSLEENCQFKDVFRRRIYDTAANIHNIAEPNRNFGQQNHSYKLNPNDIAAALDPTMVEVKEADSLISIRKGVTIGARGYSMRSRSIMLIINGLIESLRDIKLTAQNLSENLGSIAKSYSPLAKTLAKLKSITSKIPDFKSATNILEPSSRLMDELEYKRALGANRFKLDGDEICLAKGTKIVKNEVEQQWVKNKTQHTVTIKQLERVMMPAVILKTAERLQEVAKHFEKSLHALTGQFPSAVLILKALGLKLA